MSESYFVKYRQHESVQCAGVSVIENVNTYHFINKDEILELENFIRHDRNFLKIKTQESFKSGKRVVERYIPKNCIISINKIENMYENYLTLDELVLKYSELDKANDNLSEKGKKKTYLGDVECLKNLIYPLNIKIFSFQDNCVSSEEYVDCWVESAQLNVDETKVKKDSVRYSNVMISYKEKSKGNSLMSPEGDNWLPKELIIISIEDNQIGFGYGLKE